jgi:dolichyl-phosphate beta-glucosyltransferase
MENAAPLVSFVIPVHNEEALVEATAAAVVAIGERLGDPFELCLVENGSHDQTWEIITHLERRDPRIRALRTPVASYGDAVRFGLEHAAAGVVVVFDCDLYDEGFARDALAMVAADAQVAAVVASKNHAESADERSALRRAGTKVYTALVKALVGLSVSDTHGMKVVAVERVRDELAACCCGAHVFDTELIVRAERAGKRIVELPCVVRELRPARTGFLSRVPSALADLWRMRRSLRAERRS